MHHRYGLALAGALMLSAPLTATAAGTIKIAFPIPLSTPAAACGRSILADAQMNQIAQENHCAEVRKLCENFCWHTYVDFPNGGLMEGCIDVCLSKKYYDPSGTCRPKKSQPKG